MILTRIRQEMAWQEVLTSYGLIQLLRKASEFHERHPDFQLYVPIQKNLLRNEVPDNLRSMIFMLNQACSMINYYGRVCESIIESLTLAFIDGMKKDDKTSMVFDLVKKERLKDPELCLTYVLLRRILKNLQFEGSWDYLIRTILSPRFREDPAFPRPLPALSLPESFAYFNRERARRIPRIISTLSGAIRAEVKSKEDFERILQSKNIVPLEYEEILEYIDDCLMASRVIFRDDVIVTPINGNIYDNQKGKAILDKFRSHQPLKLFDWVLAGCARSSIFIIKDKDGIHVGTLGRDKKEFSKYFYTSNFTVLKYSFLNPQEKCPFSIESSGSEVARLKNSDTRKGFILCKGFQKCGAHDCMGPELLQTLSLPIRIVPGP